MTNGEKYKTLDDRTKAFYAFCHNNDCGTCKNSGIRECGRIVKCSYAWLELEAEVEQPLPCPFCGRELDVSKAVNTKSYSIYCDCGYHAPWKRTKHEAIASHNRVARTVMAAKEKEAK